ncbi:MAG: hypothetical protein ABSB95_04895 [Dissulfurispiraceae bacterium]|jgi:hypothetical protein
MFIDARGFAHPEHLKEFKKHLAGCCTVDEDVEVLIDNLDRELKMFELYIRSFNCAYTVVKEGEQVRITLKSPFNICGF